MILSYVNFTDGNAFITLETALAAVVIGLFIGCIVALYSKVYLGKLVRTLIKKEAIGEDSAIAFSDLGMKPTRLIRRALRDSSALRKHVFVKNPEEAALPDTSSDFTKKLRKFFRGKETRDTVYDLSAVRLYIPFDKKYSAEVKYENRGNPALIIILAAILFAAAAALFYFGLPELLEMADSVVTSMKNL